LFEGLGKSLIVRPGRFFFGNYPCVGQVEVSSFIVSLRTGSAKVSGISSVTVVIKVVCGMVVILMEVLQFVPDLTHDQLFFGLISFVQDEFDVLPGISCGDEFDIQRFLIAGLISVGRALPGQGDMEDSVGFILFKWMIAGFIDNGCEDLFVNEGFKGVDLVEISGFSFEEFCDHDALACEG